MKKNVLLFVMAIAVAVVSYAQPRQGSGYTEAMPIPEPKTGLLETPKSLVYVKSSVNPQYGTEVGGTYYDYQTNGSMQERIHVDAAGNVRMVWTQGLDTVGGGTFPDRGVGYNYYDASTQTFVPGDSANAPNGLAPSRVGWPTLAAKEGSEIVAAHALVILKNATPGQTNWTSRVPTEITGGTLFPHFHYNESNSTLHMTYSNTARTGFLYSKSTDDGDNFSTVDVDIAAQFGLTSKITFNNLRDDVHDMASKGDTLVIGAGGFGSDYYLFKSYDNGDTWTDTVKVHGVDTVGTFFDGSGFQVWGPDNTAKIAIDGNGIVHVVAGLSGNLINTDLSQAGSYYPLIRGIFYWNETMGANVNINDSADYANHIIVDSIADPLIPGGTYVGSTDSTGLLVSGLFSHPNIILDDNGDAIVLFSGIPAGASQAATAVGGIQRKDLYAMRLYAATGEWSDVYNVADLAGAADGLSSGTSIYEEIYPITPRTVHNGMIHVLYQVGQTPGSAIIDDKFTFAEEKKLAHYAFSASLVGLNDDLETSTSVAEGFKVYPNPAIDLVNVELKNNNSNVMITLSNSIGQVVRNIDLNGMESKNVTLDVSDLEYGVYFITVNDGNSKSTQRVIVE